METGKEAGFRDALRRARRAYEARHGDIKQSEIGARVARLLGEEEPFTVQRVSLWFAGQEPKFAIGCALALVLEVDPLELAGLAHQPGGCAAKEDRPRLTGQPTMGAVRSPGTAPAKVRKRRA